MFFNSTKLKSLFLVSSLVAFAACDSGSVNGQFQDLRPTGPAPTSSDSSTTSTPPAPTAPAKPDPTQAAGTCVSTDSNHMCIGVKVVAYKDSNGNAVTQAQSDTLMQGINALWATCNIGFQVEEYDAVDPSQYGLSYGASSENELTQIRQTFSNNTTFLLAMTGAWNTSTIAWTEMPGAAPYGAVVDADYSKDAVTVGHELGHYMGLDHDPNVGNLMYYIAYSTDKTITSAQCDQARQTNQAYWQAMMRH